MAESRKFANVDEYAESLSGATRAKFDELRTVLAKAAPGATEGISYNIAALKDSGYFIYFSGAKKHVSVYPAPTGIAEFEEAIAPYHTGKGTLQFALDKPLPEELIARVAQYRRAELQAKNDFNVKKGKK
jgi:uncharacterized protein YdhG (YjbR/CyaY superfamily)